jgi:hypothetical protein
LKFSKKCGNLEDYYNKLKKIISLVKKIIWIYLTYKKIYII